MQNKIIFDSVIEYDACEFYLLFMNFENEPERWRVLGMWVIYISDSMWTPKFFLVFYMNLSCNSNPFKSVFDRFMTFLLSLKISSILNDNLSSVKTSLKIQFKMLLKLHVELACGKLWNWKTKLSKIQFSSPNEIKGKFYYAPRKKIMEMEKH